MTNLLIEAGKSLIKVMRMLQVRMLIHKDREGYVGMKKEPYSRITMALKYHIKEFVTHPNCQQVSHHIHASLITYITALFHSKLAFCILYIQELSSITSRNINRFTKFFHC